MNKLGGGGEPSNSRSERRSIDEELRREGNGDKALEFIGMAAAELADLARLHGFDLLGRVLSMAWLEADEQRKSRREQRPS